MLSTQKVLNQFPVSQSRESTSTIKPNRQKTTSSVSQESSLLVNFIVVMVTVTLFTLGINQLSDVVVSILQTTVQQVNHDRGFK